jgi:hypothetical protein
MRFWVAPVALVCASVLAGCSGQNPVHPTPHSDQPMARVIGFGTIANGNTTGGPIVDLAACLRPPSSSNCVSAAPFSAIGTVAGLSTSGAPTNLVASVVGSTVTLAWTAPNGGDPVSSYVIEAGTATGLANLASFSTGNASRERGGCERAIQ